jgi:hypothetical protein
MTGFKFDRFAGLSPRTPASLLPPNAATVAQNCDLAYGELRNTRGDFAMRALANVPVSMYTDDGLLFYSWPMDVDAVRSPLARDTFDRLYFTTPDDFRVTTRGGMSPAGGQPASSYRVGVLRPSVAPTLTVDSTPALGNATLAAKFHYEYAGVKYQEADVTLNTVEVNKKFTFTPPGLISGNGEPNVPAGTPAQAAAVIRLTATDNTTHDVVFDLYSANSGLAVAGDWVLTLTGNTDATSYTVVLATSSTASKETRAYLYTYVNTYGEEGPASPPASLTALANLFPTVGVTRDVQSADYAPIKEIRIYRTPTGSEIADYFYTGSIPVLTQAGTAFTFLDKTTAAGLNEPLASLDYYPPDPALRGLLLLPNGILTAWKGNEQHFSDAYKPWSWPPKYVKTFAHSIVGSIAIGSGALVTTLGQPFLISGVSPDSMTETKLKTPQAGVSKWAMADLGGMIAYASNDGIVVIQGGQATLDYSERYFTRDVWRARYGSGLTSMRFAVWDGRLIVYSSQNAFVPFMIQLDEAAGTMTELPTLLASCSFVSPLSDQCYFTLGTTLYEFAGGAAAQALWHSRELYFNAPVNFGAAQAVVKSGSWILRFFAGGVLRHTKTVGVGVTDFTLPSGFKADRWEVEFEGSGRFAELRVAQARIELGLM